MEGWGDGWGDGGLEGGAGFLNGLVRKGPTFKVQELGRRSECSFAGAFDSPQHLIHDGRNSKPLWDKYF